MDEEGRLVGSGGFKIDRAVALAKLSRFQLADPWEFVRSWLRAAVLQGAKTINVSCWRAGVTELSFDGESFEPDMLADPYSGLFGPEGKAGEAGRHLGIGLLGCIRLSPERIVLLSGQGTARRRWTRDKDGAEKSGPARGGPETRLIVKWSHAASVDRLLERARGCAGMLACGLHIEGNYVRPRPPGFESHDEHRTDAIRFFLRPDQDNAEGEVALFRDGIAAGVAEDGRLRGVSAALNDDAFTLDLSGSSVVRNERFRQSLEEIVAETDRRFPDRRVRTLGSRFREALPPETVGKGLLKLGAAVLVFLCIIFSGAGLGLLFGEGEIPGRLRGVGAVLTAIGLCGLYGLFALTPRATQWSSNRKEDYR